MSRQVLPPQASSETSSHEITAFARLMRAQALLRRELQSEVLAPHGLTINDFECLLHLSREEGFRLRRVDLAERLTLTPSGVTRLLDGLEDSEPRREGSVLERRARHVRGADGNGRGDARGASAPTTSTGLAVALQRQPRRGRGRAALRAARPAAGRRGRPLRGGGVAACRSRPSGSPSSPARSRVADALVSDTAEAARLLDARLPDDWPDAELAELLPVYARPSARGSGRARVRHLGARRTRRAGRSSGSAGFLGSPTTEGTVELGYGVHDEHREPRVRDRGGPRARRLGARPGRRRAASRRAAARRTPRRSASWPRPASTQTGELDGLIRWATPSVS